MWYYAWLFLRRQKGKSLLLSSGFLLAASALILLSATTQTAIAQGNQIINRNWRSTYDLVVLPQQARVSSTHNLLPGDFLEGYDGGISLQQLAQIQRIPGVEVAAPIAFVGYVQLPTPQVIFSQDALADGYYRLDYTLVAFNGLKKIVERQQTTYFYHSNSCFTGQSIYSQELVAALQAKNIQLECGRPGDSPGTSYSEFSTPDSGTFLLAAIDSSAEDHLVNLSAHVSNGRMLESQDTIHPSTDPKLAVVHACPPGTKTDDLSKCRSIPNKDIPVILNQQEHRQVILQGSFARIAPASLSPQTVLTRGGATYLAKLAPIQMIFQGTIPLVQDDPQLFSTREILWNGKQWVPFVFSHAEKLPTDYHVTFLSVPSALTYQQTAPPANESGPAYVVMPDGTQGPEVAFRQLQNLSIDQVVPPKLPSEFYFFKTVGELKGDALSAQFANPLNWLPENTYTSAPATLLYDPEGHAVQPTGILPTTNPAGFQLQPPLAITTLSAAAQLRGTNIISAIRIRVSGVDAANPASWERIQKLAGLIERSTHLRALVTLGSSPHPTLVYVPGVAQGQFGATQSIPPLGWVEERWISIGVSILYLGQLGATRLLLLGIILLSCLGYLGVSFTAFATSQRREFAVLSALGWRPVQITRLFLLQSILVALSGGIAGLLLALGITALLGAEPIWLIVIWTLPLLLALALVSALYPLRLIYRIQPAEILRLGSTITRTRIWRISLVSLASPFWVLVLRNLARTRPRTLLTLGSFFLSTVLLLMMLTGILALRQSLAGTLLGNFVLLETALPQLAGCVVALLLSFLSVTDFLLLQVRDRRQEIGVLAALGWRSGMIQRLFVLEGILLAFLGMIPGILAAEWFLAFQRTSQHLVPPLLLALGIVALLLVTTMLATLPALALIKRLPVNELLRAA